jgi:hypothetical protein
LPNIVPELLDEEGYEITPMKQTEAMIAEGYQTIDQVFSTNQANKYTPEIKDLYSKYGLLKANYRLLGSLGKQSLE